MNWLVSTLAVGTTALLYDGSPFVGRGAVIFDLAQKERMTHLGTSMRLRQPTGFPLVRRRGRPSSSAGAISSPKRRKPLGKPSPLTRPPRPA